jgi:shikimate dehydrogenase
MAGLFVSTLTGCFSHPAAGNPSVVMVEAAYRHHGMEWRYLNVDVEGEDLGDAVRGARAMGWAGFNLSIPHKVAVIEHLDGLGESAEIIGAVNCVVRRGDELIGENTDGRGFVEAFRAVGSPAGKRLMLLGAGGAARAIGVEMALAGASHVTVVNRGVERGEAVAGLIASRTPAGADFVVWEGDVEVPEDVEILVQATPVGLYPDVGARLALDVASLRPGLTVADVVVNPPETGLLRAARAAGCEVIDGHAMLVGQGVLGVRLWSGVDVDGEVMRRALAECFGR